MAKITDYLDQGENNLIAKKDCKVIIDMNQYRLKDTIQIKEREAIIWVKSLISRAEFSDIVFNLMIDYPVELNSQRLEQIGKEQINLTYNKNDEIFTIPFTTVEIKEQVNYVKRLLGGGEMYKDPAHLLKKLYNIYGSISDLDLVHIEVLASQVLRDKKDHSVPARLGKKWDPVMANIKTDVFATGFVQGLAFENIGKAIEVGLTTAKPSEKSVLERVVTGEIVKGRKK